MLETIGFPETGNSKANRGNESPVSNPPSLQQNANTKNSIASQSNSKLSDDYAVRFFAGEFLDSILWNQKKNHCSSISNKTNDLITKQLGAFDFK